MTKSDGMNRAIAITINIADVRNHLIKAILQLFQILKSSSSSNTCPVIPASIVGLTRNIYSDPTTSSA
jgi:hypothetical protein